jgi:hypothetical protein
MTSTWNIGTAKRLIKAAGFFPRKEPQKQALGIWTASHAHTPGARKLSVITYEELLAPEGEAKLQQILADLSARYRQQTPRIKQRSQYRGPGKTSRSSS